MILENLTSWALNNNRPMPISRRLSLDVAKYYREMALGLLASHVTYERENS